jgi:lipoprotein LprG
VPNRYVAIAYRSLDDRYDPRVRRIVWLALAAVLLVASCGSNSEASLPSGPDLLKKSAEAMKAVKTVAFSIDTKDKPAVPVRHAEGSLTSAGDAKGTLQIDFGGLQELEFVVSGDTVHFKGPTGGFQKMTRQQLAAIYDPSAVLTGVPELLSAAQDARSEAAEKVGDADAYRVAVTLPQQSLAKLVPGVQQGVNGTVWIDKATSRLLKIDLPLTGGSVIVTLDDYDAPVTITPPTS